jgi:hypothetical protein
MRSNTSCTVTSVLAVCITAGWVSAAVAQGSNLTCAKAWGDIPTTTDVVEMAGSAVKFKYGISRDFGGVGVELQLTNLAYPTQSVGILEGRSAAGAGWQWSQVITGIGGASPNVLTNQAAGNSLGSQWGWSNNTSGACTASNCYVNATNWAPLYRDSLDGAGNSPCPTAPGNSWAWDAGKFDMAAQPVPISGLGQAITFTRLYTVTATEDQYWAHVRGFEAHYFRRKTARDADLRMFVKMKDGSTLGPLRPYDAWPSSPYLTAKTLSAPATGAWSEINRPIDHIVLIWNIFGLDVGIAIRNLQDRATIRMVENTYCTVAGNDECGSIDLITYQPAIDNPSSVKIFPVGATRTSQVDYHIGTKAQLQALGYWLQ